MRALCRDAATLVNRRVVLLATASGLTASTLAGSLTSAAHAAEPVAQPLQPVELPTTVVYEPIVTDVPDEAQISFEYTDADGVVAVQAEPAPLPPPPPPPPPPPLRTQAAAISLEYQGRPYVWGAASPDGFDCSGLVVMVYGRLGVTLPHQSSAIMNSPRTQVISAAEAQPGDLIWTPGHISIYQGNGQQMEAHGAGTLSGVYPIWQKNPTFLRVV